MAKSDSYEVLSTSRGDNWIIQSVYDDETDRTISRTIFNEARGAAKAKAKLQAQEEAANVPAGAAVGRKTGDSDFIKYLIILVLSIGGIALVLLAGAAFLVDAFGGG